MKITANLSWDEVLRGSGYNYLDEVPDDVRRCMESTAKDMFQPIREGLGKAVSIVPGGGIREPELNDRVGGAKKSQHLFGRALDLRCRKPEDTVAIYDLVIEMQADGRLPIGGCALYVTKSGRPRFVHVDCRGRKARWNMSARSKVDW